MTECLNSVELRVGERHAASASLRGLERLSGFIHNLRSRHLC